jgi:hypothetical protein
VVGKQSNWKTVKRRESAADNAAGSCLLKKAAMVPIRGFSGNQAIAEERFFTGQRPWLGLPFAAH